MKVIDKGVQIERQPDGTLRYRQHADIACESKDEQEKVEDSLRRAFEAE